MPKFKDFAESTYTVPMVKRKLPPLVTDVKPQDRSFKNLPKYSTGKSKVRFQDWLMIKPEKTHPDHSACSFGKSEADGKWYGWSHRAVAGFGKGGKVSTDTCGNESGKEYTIKTDDQAKDVAIAFAKDIS